MIEKSKIENLISDVLVEKGIFIVTLNISTNNRITLLIDSQEGVKINDCAAISRVIENGMDRNSDDFELEVSSPGIDSPLKVIQQYKKNLGKEIEVTNKDGSKVKGILLDFDDEKFSVEEKRTIKEKNKKKKQIVVEKLSFTYDEVSKVKTVLKF
ncbi:MAG: ribosome assembly cofactor RimP [Bacteroidales bacterium]|nr:ribosome assembly cofactor RimP [Bacteroidales bacterium]